jgi:hypothetical protein
MEKQENSRNGQHLLYVANVDHFHFLAYNYVPLKRGVFLFEVVLLTGELPDGNNKSVDP